MTDKQTTSRSRITLVSTACLIIAIVICYFVIPSFQAFIHEAFEILTSENEEKISDWVSQFGVWGPVFIIVAMVAQMFLIIFNVVLLILVAVLAYGPVWGSLLGILSICVASTVGYFIGKSLSTYTVYKMIGKQTEKKVEKYTRKYGYGTVVIFRISPFLSNDAISFVAGLINMNFWKFLLATLAGIIPLTAIIAWMSEDMERLKNGFIWVSVFSLIVFIGYIVYDRLSSGKG